MASLKKYSEYQFPDECGLTMKKIWIIPNDKNLWTKKEYIKISIIN